MQDDVNNKDVIEIGGGTGRLTAHLVEIANCLTSVDLCERMIQRNKQNLGEKASRVNYVNTFMQEYYPPRKHQVAICSQVLIHNVSDSDFMGLVRRICDCSDTAFVFEDVTEGRPTSKATCLRPKQTIVKAFEQFNFHLERSGNDRLCDDQITFLKFVRMQ